MHTILLVDDDVTILDVLGLMLEQAGFQVVRAANGQQGLDAAMEARPDIIITDVLMPVMDGYLFYKELKASPTLRHIPVIILTARGKMQASFEAIGADIFLEKPAPKETLLAHLEQLLHKQADAKEGHPHVQKILIAGTYPEVVSTMARQLADKRYIVQTVKAAAEVIPETVKFGEDMLIIETQMEKECPVADVIRAVRLLPSARHIPIILYSYFRVAELNDGSVRERMLDTEKALHASMQAGGTAYLDRFNELTFLEQLGPFV